MFSENQSMIISINNRFTFMDKKFIRYEGGGGAGGCKRNKKKKSFNYG